MPHFDVKQVDGKWVRVQGSTMSEERIPLWKMSDDELRAIASGTFNPKDRMESQRRHMARTILINRQQQVSNSVAFTHPLSRHTKG